MTEKEFMEWCFDKLEEFYERHKDYFEKGNEENSNDQTRQGVAE